MRQQSNAIYHFSPIKYQYIDDIKYVLIHLLNSIINLCYQSVTNLYYYVHTTS